MSECVGNEIFRGSICQKKIGAFFGRKDRHGIVKDGRPAADLLVRFNSRAVTRFDAAYSWRDDFEHRSFVVQLFPERVEKRTVYAIGHQGSDFSTGEALRRV